MKKIKTIVRLTTALLIALLTAATLSACILGPTSSNTTGSTVGEPNSTGTLAPPSDLNGKGVKRLLGGIKTRAFSDYQAPGAKAMDGHIRFADKSDLLLVAIKDFTKESFLAKAKDHSEKSLLMSPISLYFNLAMLGEGTAGNTRAEISAALAGAIQIEEDEDFLRLYRNEMKELLYGLSMDYKSMTSKVAQSLWYRPDIPIKDSYLELLDSTYSIDVYLADFQGKPEAVKLAMDEWASLNTNELIDELPIEISPTNVFYLLQALYFKDSWFMAFHEEANTTGKFQQVDGGSEDATFMNQTLLPAWGYKHDDYIAAELMTEQQFSFRVILPNETLELEEVLELDSVYDVLFSNHLTEQSSKTWANDWQVNWSVPKFDVGTSIDLLDLMDDLGISDVKGANADFSNAADVSPGSYQLTAAKQEVRIKVDEKGIEAAAVTILGVDESMPMIQGELGMTLDRPFLFTISTPSGLPLFIAYVGNLG